MADTEQIQACPMAATCEGMMKKRRTGFLMMIPGVILIVLGVTIIVYPQVLVWIVSIASIAMGVAMLMMVNFMRNFGRRLHNRHG